MAREREKREMWEEMTEDECLEAGESFDISSLSFKPLSPDEDVEDEDIWDESAIIQQSDKEHCPVRYIQAMYALCFQKHRCIIEGYISTESHQRF